MGALVQRTNRQRGGMGWNGGLHSLALPFFGLKNARRLAPSLLAAPASCDIGWSCGFPAMLCQWQCVGGAMHLLRPAQWFCRTVPTLTASERAAEPQNIVKITFSARTREERIKSALELSGAKRSYSPLCYFFRHHAELRLDLRQRHDSLLLR